MSKPAASMAVTISRKALAALLGATRASFWRGRNAHLPSCSCRYCVAIREAMEALPDE